MNKIEENIEAAWQRSRGAEEYDPGYPVKASSNFVDGFKAGAEWALQLQWVSVEDAPPELNNDVLVTYTDHITNNVCVGIANYDATDGEWYSNDDVLLSRRSIRFWMPIPPLPEARKGDNE